MAVVAVAWQARAQVVARRHRDRARELPPLLPDRTSPTGRKGPSIHDGPDRHCLEKTRRRSEGALRMKGFSCRRHRSLLTRWWRKTDSNHRSLSSRIPLFRLVLPAGGVEEACSEKPPVLGGDRQFESVFLRRPVCLTSAFHA